MSSDETRPVLLTTAAHEPEAAVIVAALEAAGIQSVLTGVHTSVFRAEAPGQVQVLVRESDLSQAQQILDALRESP